MNFKPLKLKFSTPLTYDAVISAIKVLFAAFISLRFSLLPHDMFKDRDNYLFRIDSSEFFLVDSLRDAANFLFSEPLFSISNHWLSYFFDSSVLLSIYVFLNTFFVLLLVLLNRKSLAYSIFGLLLLATIPYFYGATLGAVRQGLGFNFVILSLMRKKPLTNNFFLFSLFIASLFHVIFYVFLALGLIYKLLKTKIRDERIVLAAIFFCILLIGFLWGFVTPFLSDSQSYNDFNSNTSGVTFLGWLLVFLVFLYSFSYINKLNLVKYDDMYVFSIFMFLCFFVFYWLAPGPYRILYSFSPVLVSAIMSYFNRRAFLCYLALFYYSLFLLSIGAGSGSMTVSFSQFLTTMLVGSS